jgi:hypothetical protein
LSIEREKGAKKVFQPPAREKKKFTVHRGRCVKAGLTGGCRTALRTSHWFPWKINERYCSLLFA